MYLKAIDIHGFKSFAEKTTLTFSKGIGTRNSITAIVGPNGSGKSNVSDAIRWVMGEQKMSSLRAKKGEDIIFSGSDAKGKMGMASVTLYVDNTDKRVDIEYDELVITRKLYRSGESEYLLNGNTIRLIDLQILLAKAQFGQGSYSVVGQGMIDKMLLQTPADRKDFFDEAAGIKEFQIKRHQASLKLHKTREHMEQATMVLQEVEPQLKRLSRQVKKLEERQEVETSLRECQEQHAVTVYAAQKAELDAIQEKLATVTEQFTEKSSTLQRIQEELATQAKAESQHERFDALQQSYQKIVDKQSELERERAVLQGRMNVEYSKSGKQNVGWLEDKVEQLTQQQEGATKEVEKTQARVRDIEGEVRSAKERVETLRNECVVLRTAIQQLQQDAVEQHSRQTLFQFTGLRAVQAILEERHRFGEVHGAVAQLGQVEEKYQTALDVAAGGHLSSLVVADDRVASDCIDYLRANRLGYATFLPLSKIQPRFIPQEIEALANEPGVLGLALDLVTFDSKYVDIFQYVFGSTLVVEDLAVARRIGIGRARMVTLDGDIMERSGSMKGGYRSTKEKHGLSFSNTQRGQLVSDGGAGAAEELEKKQQELSQKEIDKETAQQQAQELEQQLQRLRGEADLLASKQAQLSQEQAGLQQELKLHTMAPEEYDTVMQEIAQNRESIETELKKIAEERVVIQAKIDSFHAEEEEKKQRVFALQEQMQQEQAALNEIVTQRNALQVDEARIQTKQEDHDRDVYQELHTTPDQIAARGITPVSAEALEEVGVQIQKLKYKLSLIGGIDDEVIEEHDEIKERHEGLTTQLDDLEKAADDLETLIAELDEVMKKRRARAFKQIKKEFARYFSQLFEGGTADLKEVYEDEIVEEDGEQQEGEDEEVSQPVKTKKKKRVLAGIDVVANPPGKKIAHLQTLSGGERTMTSIALVCAILKTNPSPFVVLDEVEAALDEANSIRLTNIIQELATESQFILITHNRATMHAADALYGVTMGNNGISHLISVKLAEAVAAVGDE